MCLTVLGCMLLPRFSLLLSPASLPQQVATMVLKCRARHNLNRTCLQGFCRRLCVLQQRITFSIGRLYRVELLAVTCPCCLRYRALLPSALRCCAGKGWACSQRTLAVVLPDGWVSCMCALALSAYCCCLSCMCMPLLVHT
ncbi:hypothetical protein COO60DRAFT_550164 [Scenedesmus sp. NREL 46B-D3]|nr:hypothetical protein COO60DRAFT_550164 [Scenedesmus sp. NREL 46B-D3]